MQSDAAPLRTLILGMRAAYARGENAMAFARNTIGSDVNGENGLTATLIAYDLQAGTYVADARRDPSYTRQWGEQIAQIIRPLINRSATLLEVGCGEATTLAAVAEALGDLAPAALGFDLSWSRIDAGRGWLKEQRADARLFSADLFAVPMCDDSIDLVYSSHSLEPNGGRESEAIAELLRVSRRYVVLVEPAYEFALEAARQRMDAHGYVRDLRRAAESCGASVLEHRPLALSSNPLNPSGVLVLEKPHAAPAGVPGVRWRCPITWAPLVDRGDTFVSPRAGLVYPVVRGIPMLRAEHAIVASALATDD
jgi:SAM-dependent methyltransferase